LLKRVGWISQLGRLSQERADMKLQPILAQTVWLLLTEGRVSYDRLRLEFELDDQAIEAIRKELIQVKKFAVDKNGEFLLWAGAQQPSATANLQPTDTLASPQLTPLASHGEAPLPRIKGTRLVPSDTMALAPAPQAPSDAERRPLTVMFCDLADSTALSTKLDPEDLQDIIRAYQEGCTALIKEYEGYVAKYMGDGILVYFGYPVSLERNAERAVRSAVAIVEIMAGLNHTIGCDKGVDIAVRIGISTGTVVVGEIVGEGLAQERTVIGEAPNIAARLQGIAARNGVVIGALTKELAGAVFAYEDLGPKELKGITGAVLAWAVTGLKRETVAVSDAAEIRNAAEVAQLVGRDEETGLLRRAWHSTKEERRGQVVTISGEAGIGKSVLVDGLTAEVRGEGLPRVTFRCSPYHTSSALYPIIEHFKRLADWQPEDSVDARLIKLEAMLERYGQPLADAVPLLAALLSLPLPDDRYPPLDLTPQQQKQQIQDTIIAMTLEDAERQCLLQIWEDLHWADPSTLELLGLVIEQSPTAVLLIVLTARPDFVPPWPARSHITPITLSRLERQHSETLIARIADMKPLPTEVVDHIVAKTDGVPLYVEELTKTILTSDVLRDSGERYELTGPLSSLSIPETLQGSLMARLDRLPQVRKIAQMGAVLGREFAYEMISGLSTISEPGLQEGLTQLVAAELLYQRGRPPHAKYIFKHALVQDAAYQSLLKRGRQQYHGQVAELLEIRFPDVAKAHPELLAHHFTEAGSNVRAVDYWQKAGMLAGSQSANLEAIGSLTKGLTLLKTLELAPERCQQELDMQVALGAVLMAAKGYGAPEVEQSYARAQELCEQLGDTLQRFPVLRGLLLYRLLRGEVKRALELAERLLASAESGGDPALLMLAHYMMAIVLLHRGKQASCQPHFAEALAIYSPQEHADLAFSYGIDLGMAARSYSCWNLWLSGYPDQASGRIQEAFALNEELSHPYSHAHALTFAAVLHQFRREPEATRTNAERAVALATEQQYSLLQSVATGLAGWSLVAGGEKEAGRKQMQKGFDAALSVGPLWRHYFLSMIAVAYSESGDRDSALSTLTEALSVMDETGDRFWGAELHRLRGEVLLEHGDGDTGEAETCFREALDLARRQDAKSLELRAATSLAHLWHHQNQSDKAHNLLAPVFEWFTEGFDTLDLSEAKELLQELSECRTA
jgi:class 3 adenylate cyclase/predicted ATPase